MVFVCDTIMMVTEATEICLCIVIYVKINFINVHLLVCDITVNVTIIHTETMRELSESNWRIFVGRVKNLVL